MMKTRRGSDSRKEGKCERVKRALEAKSSTDKVATFGGCPGLH